MSAIRLNGLSKRFGDVAAVDAVDLSIEPGELFFLLGPSGCGKTTLLRLLAGFLEPDAGRIFFGGRDVTRISPNRRGTGMVFQSYALWPHMMVHENVAYGLRARGIPPAERDARVREALAKVHMAGRADRRPAELSGGQQQRVALARALVIEPQVLLLDEPLSNLDARLRAEMREEIRRICRQTRITSVYVTHDQVEALAMADRIALMQDGRVVQVDTPRALYERPASRFAAEFLGDSNVLPGTVRAVRDGMVEVETAAGVLLGNLGTSGPEPGTPVDCLIRPEMLRLAREDDEPINRIRGQCTSTTYLGAVSQLEITLADGTILRMLTVTHSEALPTNGNVLVTIDTGSITLAPQSQ